MLGVWLLGGLLAFAGAMAYAELAALRPRAGGEYVYLREAYGPVAAFLTGWTSFVAGFSGAIAAGAVGLADYIGRFIPAAADRAPLLTVPIPFAPLVVTPQALVASPRSSDLSLVHISGLGPGRLVHNFLATLKVLALVVFVALGLSIGTGSFDAPGRRSARGAGAGHRLAGGADPDHVQLLRAGMRRPTSRRRFAIPAATCRSRWRSAPARSSSSTSRSTRSISMRCRPPNWR